ncbi:MAG: DNA topoisomerase VI subunit B [Bdellovibrionales bacterium]|nr:DNA topoisomerase VI subunit B [Bdellovibrionales bacterium]
MAKNEITTSSTAEYFAKNLQQVGFSSPTKAVLTTLKEAVDNSLDACESAKILPELIVEIQKVGRGTTKNADLIEIKVTDNGPGIEPDDLAKVFGEYLASSKFGRGQCSRGQQGIGISAATTWAQLTNATGVTVISKTSKMRKAFKAQIDVDIKKNKGLIKSKETVDWEKPHGVEIQFIMDGRVQLNGDGGLLTYLEGTTLVNPHLNLKYKLLEADWISVDRVSDDVPMVPPAVNPHPHTMKLGEFITHAHLFGKVTLRKFLKTGFSRVSDASIQAFVKAGLNKKFLDQSVSALKEADFKAVYSAIQESELMAPSTRSVLTVGEESLAKSIGRIGEVDFFSVVTRRPRICDHKPVVVEVALARFKNRGSEDDNVQCLRFANRVPLQFDKAACAITKAIESVNWRSYGLNQSKNSVPNGPYVFAVSVVSPFIKFKNASKETIDASDELVEEIRRALIQAGQKLGRHIRAEFRAEDLERKLRHLEQFGPMLVEGLVRILGASDKRRKAAEEGLTKILGRDTTAAEQNLAEAEGQLKKLKKRQLEKGIISEDEYAQAMSSGEDGESSEDDETFSNDEGNEVEVKASSKGKKSKTAKKAKAAKKKVAQKSVAKKKTSAKPARNKK